MIERQIFGTFHTSLFSTATSHPGRAACAPILQPRGPLDSGLTRRPRECSDRTGEHGTSHQSPVVLPSTK
ncbi:hypothetical protein ANANG_G00232150 [Anguilla anguilla]|uniref:Uncharacterized protein n=1 Tax=Anguilla anguilla TaxID=7936 RepID=A0A9D3RNA1_ANGAN|nr:hypothetical protein ANANG_G00232150 [Anguilla anguilla]